MLAVIFSNSSLNFALSVSRRSLRVPRVSHLSDSREEEALETRLVAELVTVHELAQQSQQSSADTNRSFLKVI